MGKKLLVLAILVCIVSAGVASAGPPIHKATGGAVWVFSYEWPPGEWTEPCEHLIAFNAQIDSSGEAKGQIEFVEQCTGRPLFHAKVTCLFVDGNQAWIGGEITVDQAGWLPVGSPFVFYVQDNGQGKAAPPDRVTYPGFSSYGIPPCTNLEYWQFMADISEPVVRGNIQVQ